MDAHTSGKRAASPRTKPWALEWETEFLTDILGVLLDLLRLRPTFGNLPEVQLGFKFGTCIILIDLLTWLCFMAYMLHYILYISIFRNLTPLKANQTQNFLVPNSTIQAEMSPKSFWKSYGFLYMVPSGVSSSSSSSTQWWPPKEIFLLPPSQPEPCTA